MDKLDQYIRNVNRVDMVHERYTNMKCGPTSPDPNCMEAGDFRAELSILTSKGRSEWVHSGPVYLGQNSRPKRQPSDPLRVSEAAVGNPCQL